MVRIALLFFPLLLALLHGCISYEPLRTKRCDNFSNALKLQGYYYAKIPNSSPVSFHTIVLYKNGVLKNIGVVFGDNFDSTNRFIH